MPLPLLVIMALSGAGAGAAVSKGTAAIRGWLNKGEKVQTPCRRCGNEGPHEFVAIDRSWVGGATIGILVGGIGGAVAGAVAKRIFRCSLCSAAMYESGERPGWNADDAIKAFLQYPTLREASEELQDAIARNQEVAKRHQEQIIKLEGDLRAQQTDKAELEQQIRALTAQIKRERAARSTA